MDVYHSIGFVTVAFLMSANLTVLSQAEENECTYRVSSVRSCWCCWDYYHQHYHFCSYREIDEIDDCCSGWKRKIQCTEMCEDGYYGYDCKDTCDCPGGSTCNHVDGSCGSLSCEDDCINNRHCNNDTKACECMPGWQGADCNKPCLKDFYGQNCNQTCVCVNHVMCNNIDGQCICNPGWTGATCNKTCDAGFYGIQCEEVCNCSSVATCDPINGTCACPPGLYGDRCQTACPAGFYGVNCSSGCLCDVGQSCDPMTGDCEDELTDEKARKQDQTKALALGISIAAIMLFLIIFVLGVAVMLWKRRIRKRRSWTTAIDEPTDQTPGDHELSGIGTSAMHPDQTSTQAGDTTNATVQQPPRYYSLELNDGHRVVTTESTFSVARHAYEDADGLGITSTNSEHVQDLDDDGEYEMLREDRPKPQDIRTVNQLRPHLKMASIMNDDDSAYSAMELEKPRETSTDYTITKPYFPGDDEPGNYEEPSEFLQNENVGNASKSNQLKSFPRSKMLDTSEAGYAIPNKRSRQNETPNSQEGLSDLQDSRDGGKIKHQSTDYEDIISHQNADVNTLSFSDNDYSKFNRNVVRSNSDETDSGNYGKLSKAAEFNESDEEYDTLRVVKHKYPENINDNTYSALQ